jgi:NTP pyrophosphatase (non-canonical NTP hydrolase)
MKAEQYAEAIKSFCIYPDAGCKTDVEKAYLSLGLASEAGEVASLMKKEMRDGVEYDGEKWLAELGDVTFYLTRLLDVYGYTMEDAMLHNVAKLHDRQQRNKLTGSGDTR